ncbi:MAG: tRNA uridine(34) 5-carboxymethylaminomethyl modification radical SAM/GNAT enzyme Elp3 [Candidatus Woesearchaeota archaeon]
MSFFEEIIEWIKENKPDKVKLSKHKKDLCKKYKIKEIPTDITIYLNASKEDAKIIRGFLQTKPMRTGSGVAVIATMTKPINCPHGSCIYCPGGIDSFYGNVPKSYTGKEPSTMRGIRNDYDPYRIVFNRLEQYVVIGQNPDKVDQIVMGGTFTAFPKKYQHDYIYYSFKAYNDFSKLFFKDGELDIDKFKEFFELPGDINDLGRRDRIREKILKLKLENVKTLEEEHSDNENSSIRCIGLTIETKPDWAFRDKGIEILNLGTTRVELGIQTVYDDILRYINRGHGEEDAKKAIADLRDLGFKLNFHMMPGLPDIDGKRISKEKDIESLQEIFSNPDYRPDMLKVYPCMVMPGTDLEKKYKEGVFIPLTTEDAAEIIVEMKRVVPEYCRIMRIQRDIPTYATTAGVGRTNLRQYVDELAYKNNVHCRCIRCREIKFSEIKEEPQIIISEYDASNGKEYFISIESDDKLLGFVRLRFPPRQLHPAITPTSALIRELHVYGQAVKIGGADTEKTQHKGYGRKLMEKAEEIARANGKDKMIVISGVGVRGYYRKIGYTQEGPYMVKGI